MATPQTVLGFTAVGYFFARELRKQLGVPIGIIHSSWGGTNGESWVSREGLSADPELKTLADTQIHAMESMPEDMKQFPLLMAAGKRRTAPKTPATPAKRWDGPSRTSTTRTGRRPKSR